MRSKEDKIRYDFAKKRQYQNVQKEISGVNAKYENDIIIQAPYDYIDEYIAKFNSIKKNRLRLLDYCCGTGLRSIKPIKIGIECYGIDISDDSIDVCKERVRTLNSSLTPNYIVGNAEDLPYKNNFFDIIISYGSLSYLDFDKSIAELTRVLKKEGIIIILDTTKNNFLINIKRFIKYKRGLVSKYHIENLFDKKKITKLENKSSLDVNTKYFHFLSTLFIFLPNKTIFNPIKKYFISLDEYLEKTFLKNYYWKFICIIKKI